jgi:ADP-heptose:LPS heptosyltransferase
MKPMELLLEPLPSAAIAVQTPTVAFYKTTHKRNHKTQSHPITRQTSLDDFALQHPVFVDKQTDEEPIA